MNDGLFDFNEVDRVIHEPARLMLVSILSPIEEADFTFLLNQTGMSKGNLSTHLTKLEEAGYVDMIKGFRGKIPQTTAKLTRKGRHAFENYRRTMKRFF